MTSSGSSLGHRQLYWYTCIFSKKFWIRHESWTDRWTNRHGDSNPTSQLCKEYKDKFFKWWCSFQEISTCTFNWCFTFTILQVPPGQFHKVHTVSEEPSCYMYIYINTTYVEIMEKVETVEKTMSEKNISAGELISVAMSVLVWMLVNFS